MALLPSGIRATLAHEAARVDAARRQSAERQLAIAARRLTQAGWRAQTQVRVGVPIDEILTAVEDTGADLLVLGARGAGDVAHALLGSVVDGALKRSPVPTLVVR
jgi:nucleotide-binding universal stress UspA family protein